MYKISDWIDCKWLFCNQLYVWVLILTVNIDNFVFLLRDREGEDTHQNVIHDTVLSFGKVTYSTLNVFEYAAAAVKVKDIPANCFCPSLLHMQIRTTYRIRDK